MKGVHAESAWSRIPSVSLIDGSRRQNMYKQTQQAIKLFTAAMPIEIAGCHQIQRSSQAADVGDQRGR
jgi:hypothetical protein